MILRISTCKCSSLYYKNNKQLSEILSVTQFNWNYGVDADYVVNITAAGHHKVTCHNY